ncbi:MAG: hypothetical protein LBF28_00005, partial [Rickettsiales bacterium]|nr:hypothetical protein [Rickettsiales bacterium]
MPNPMGRLIWALRLSAILGVGIKAGAQETDFMPNAEVISNTSNDIIGRCRVVFNNLHACGEASPQKYLNEMLANSQNVKQ